MAIGHAGPTTDAPQYARRDTAVRRVVDVCVSLLLGLIVAPLLAVLFVLVRLDSPGPVIYRQDRVGRDRTTFRICKIRTMRADADRGALVTARHDDRITGIGRVLRATKLDELPQLWNVLLGDMTLIGPRPEVPRYITAYAPDELAVLEVRPGMTGPGQLYYNDDLLECLGNAVDPEAYYVAVQLHPKLAVELAYVMNRSTAEDVRIVVGTLRLILSSIWRPIGRWSGRRLGRDQSAGPLSRQSTQGKRAVLSVLLVALLLGGLVSTAAMAWARGRPAPLKYRYITDSRGAEHQAAGTGFNLLDTSAYAGEVSQLPRGTRALVWLGNFDNNTCTWTLSDARVAQLVRPLAGNPRVAGYYLADEPDPAQCPTAPAQLAARSALVHRLATSTFTYAVIEAGDSYPGKFASFRHTVDFIGLDPYPCTFRYGCRFDKIDAAVRQAHQEGLTHIWGVVQAFQDDYYRYPTPSELRVILRRWHQAGVSGEQVFAWSYLGHTLSRHPKLVAVLRRDNLRH